MKKVSEEKKAQIEEQRKKMKKTFYHHFYIRHRNQKEQSDYNKAIKKGLEPPETPIKRASCAGVFYDETKTLAIGIKITAKEDQFSRPYGRDHARTQACQDPIFELSITGDVQKEGKKAMINYINSIYDVVVPVKKDDKLVYISYQEWENTHFENDKFIIEQ